MPRSQRAEPTRFPFTKAALEALQQKPPARHSYVYDTKARALAASVSPKGRISFLLYRSVHGRPRRIRIGPFPALSIAQARERAERLNGAIAAGEPVAGRPHAVGELFTEYLRHARDHKASWREDERQYHRYLLPWQDRRLEAVRRHDVEELHARIGKQAGHYAANRLLALLSAMFNRAIAKEWMRDNPAKGVRRFREDSRERFLDAEELGRFFAALEEEPEEDARDFFSLLLLTGARRGNVMAMHWDQVDLAERVWRIPKTKSGRPLQVPLAAPALAILARRADTDATGYVFPGRGKAGHITEVRAAWERLRDRAELSDLRMHDLRRTMGSWQAATGASLPVIGKSLGHSNAATTQIYARLNIDPVRAAVETAAAAMVAAGRPRGKK